jgi:hypothetical protein
MGKRYRCSGCGNLTRFDVVTSRRTRAFHHFSIGGELHVEDEETLEETVEAVTCRWCGGSQSIEELGEDLQLGETEPPAGGTADLRSA